MNAMLEVRSAVRVEMTVVASATSPPTHVPAAIRCTQSAIKGTTGKVIPAGREAEWLFRLIVTGQRVAKVVATAHRCLPRAVTGSACRKDAMATAINPRPSMRAPQTCPYRVSRSRVGIGEVRSETRATVSQTPVPALDAACMTAPASAAKVPPARPATAMRRSRPKAAEISLVGIADASPNQACRRAHAGPRTRDPNAIAPATRLVDR